MIAAQRPSLSHPVSDATPAQQAGAASPLFGKWLLPLLMVLLPLLPLHAQDDIRLHLDGQHFLIDNEYFGLHNQGYTLPGFRLDPTLAWQVDERLQLKLGVHWLHYWGAHRYPAGFTYGVLPTEADSTTSRHVLPLLQARYAPTKHLTLVMGSLDASSHGLVAPLFNSKRLQAADPESGAELLLCFSHFEADVWVDWQQFVWRRSPYQEQFLMGIHAAWRTNWGQWGLEVPVSFLGKHTGGQMLATPMRVKNIFNESVGIEAERMLQAGRLEKLRIGMHLLHYHSSGPTGLPAPSGNGLYLHATLAVRPVDATIAYWHGHRFESILGSPLYYSHSVVDPTAVFNKVDLFSFTLRYNPTGSPLGLFATVFRYVDQQDPLFSFGCTLSFHPTISLRK